MIEEEFIGRGEVRGFRFRQLEKRGRVYLYEVDGGYGHPHYEVFRARYNKLLGRYAYPKSKGFGANAFSYFSLPAALVGFHHLGGDRG